MQHAPHGPRRAFDQAEIVALIDAEGHVARGLTSQAIDHTCAALGWHDRSTPVRIADLGSGPGVDACALAEAFPNGAIIAVDDAPAMLVAAGARAEAAGVADRVSLAGIDLEGELTSLGTLDLAWAALSLHHLRDCTATIARVAAQLREGGALSVLERDAPLDVRPADELGRRGLWERVSDAQAAWYRQTRASHPSHVDLRQLTTLVAAGNLTVAHASAITSTTSLPASTVCHLLATRHVQAALHNLTDLLEPADVDALRDPGATPRLGRSAAVFRATRLLVIGAATPAADDRP